MNNLQRNKIILVCVFSAIVIILCGVAIYFTSRKKKAKGTQKKENPFIAKIKKSESKPPEEKVPQTIKEMDPEIRVQYGKAHDILFEKEKIEELMGFIQFPNNWYVKPLPPRNNYLQHLQITDDLNKMPVTVQFDAHGIHNNNDEPGWQVSLNGRRVEVYGTNTKELISAIEQMLETAPPAVKIQ